MDVLPLIYYHLGSLHISFYTSASRICTLHHISSQYDDMVSSIPDFPNRKKLDVIRLSFRAIGVVNVRKSDD
jgi:hypothetical protein